MSELVGDFIKRGETKEVNILREEVIVYSVNEEQKGYFKKSKCLQPSMVHSLDGFAQKI